jgi:hypothetical protein
MFGYQKDQLEAPVSIIDKEVTPGNMIYVLVNLNKRIRIDTVTTVFPSGTTVEREAVDIAEDDNNLNKPNKGQNGPEGVINMQWFYFVMPESSVQIDLYCELRTYKLKIRADKYNKMSILPESGIYDYEPNDICSIQFELKNCLKLNENSGAYINYAQYDIISRRILEELVLTAGVFNLYLGRPVIFYNLIYLVFTPKFIVVYSRIP